jgi:hypothetical protein
MYWVFFILFVLAALTPEVIRSGFFGLSEEGTETLLVFALGMTGFLLFFGKEKSLLRQVRDRLRLQREKSDITKDLSESYSYIGEANRKLDLIKGLILSLPDTVEGFRKGEVRKSYRAFERSVLLSCKSASFLIRIVDIGSGTVEKEIRNGKVAQCVAIPLATLISSGKKMFEENGCVIVRSPGMIGKKVAFLMFPKSTNRDEDPGILEALATQGLVLHFLEREGSQSFRESETKEKGNKGKKR